MSVKLKIGYCLSQTLKFSLGILIVNVMINGL